MATSARNARAGVCATRSSARWRPLSRSKRRLSVGLAEDLRAVKNGTSPALSLLIDMAKVPDEPPEYVIEPLAAKGYLTLLPGRRNAYKSMLVMMAGACCHGGGGELAGLHCAPAITLDIDAENGPWLMRRRFTLAGIKPDGLLVADGTKIKLPGSFPLLR